MSARQDVYNAVVAALGASTGVSYITTKNEAWWDWAPNRFPGVRARDGGEELLPLSYFGSTAINDMEASMTIDVSGYVQDLTNQSVADKRAELIAEIQKVMLTSTGITDVTADVWPISVETDDGVVDNYGWCNCKFKVRYFYKHAAP